MARNRVRKKKQERFLTYRWMEGLLRKGVREMTEAHKSGEKISVTDFARVVRFHRDKYGLYRPECVVEWIDRLEPVTEVPID